MDMGHERSRHCQRPPISVIKNQAETKEKTKEQGDQKEICYNYAQFSLKSHNKYDILQDYDETDDEEVEKQWQDFEAAYKETAQEVLGYKKKGKKP